MKHTSFSMTDEMMDKILSFISGTETVSQFAYKATEEKLKRMDVRDKSARLQLHEKNIEALTPVIMDILITHGIIKR